MSKIIVAIDGPAASGKSTAAKKLAEHLNFVYLDTGAMYRAITYLALKEDIVDNEGAIIEMTKNLDMSLKFENGVTRVFVNDDEVTDFIRTKEVNARVSDVSRIKEVRTELVKIQKRLSEKGSLVAEGRDITTVVFPEADVKIFMTASLDVRTDRRHKEFLEKGMDLTYDEVKENLINRDKIDSGRKVSPLKKADDAYELDTTDLSVGQEIDIMLDLVNKLESHRN
jgi:cytidylate kinase